MRVTREQADQNRKHIIDTAARLFREKGYSGIGVADLMKEAGLTHGGFYGNFDSKEHLMAAACARAFDQGSARLAATIAQDPETALARIVSSYLSRRHVDAPGQGCVAAALGGEVARLSDPVRDAASTGVAAQIDQLAPLMAGGSAQEQRRAATAAYASMVGALVLARAVNDATLGGDILRAVETSLLAGR